MSQESTPHPICLVFHGRGKKRFINHFHLEIGPNEHGGISSQTAVIYNDPNLQRWILAKLSAISFLTTVKAPYPNWQRYTIR